MKLNKEDKKKFIIDFMDYCPSFNKELRKLMIEELNNPSNINSCYEEIRKEYIIDFINNSFLSEKTKKLYLKEFHETGDLEQEKIDSYNSDMEDRYNIIREGIIRQNQIRTKSARKI